MIKRFIKKRAVYIYLPLSFLLLGYLFLYFAFSPFISLGVSVWETIVAEATGEQNEGIYKDIYTENIFSGYDASIPSSEVVYPTNGTRYGKIIITHGDEVFDIPLFFGDSSAILRRGAGHYKGSHFPGEGSTILVSAHNNTYFNCLKLLEVGDIIEVKTNYGNYKYEVTELYVKHLNSETAYDLEAKEENLVLYTCYPFNALGLTSQRYFVKTKLVSGPFIDFSK